MDEDLKNVIELISRDIKGPFEVDTAGRYCIVYEKEDAIMQVNLKEDWLGLSIQIVTVKSGSDGYKAFKCLKDAIEEFNND